MTTLTSFDTIDGGAGVDTLNAFFTGLVASVAGSVKNVENVNFNVDDAFTANVSTWTGASKVPVVEATAAKAVDITAAAASVSVTGGAGDKVTDGSDATASKAGRSCSPGRCWCSATCRKGVGKMFGAELAKVNEWADLQGQAFVPVLAPVVRLEVGGEIAPLPAQTLPGLLPEAELPALPEAPLVPFAPTGRFEQAVPFGLEEYLELVNTMGRAVHPAKRCVTPARLVDLRERRQTKFLHGMRAARQVLGRCEARRAAGI